MGICESKKEPEMSTRNKSFPIKVYEKAKKSVCKIIIKANPNNSYATGYFMKVSDTEKYLVTNNHVISQNKYMMISK